MTNSIITIIGFGSIGQGLVPILRDRFPNRAIQVITADDRGIAVVDEFNLIHHIAPLTPQYYEQILNALVPPHSILINVSVDVSSCALIEWAARNDVMYLDTCVEPWSGGYNHGGTPVSNHELRERALALGTPNSATAVISSGANPGLISHFAKDGLLRMWQYKSLLGNIRPAHSWADLSALLGVRVLQISEVDHQTPSIPYKKGKFYNTWSVDGFISELHQQAEMGWGTHESSIPAGARHASSRALESVCLPTLGVDTHVRMWNPTIGHTRGRMVTHHESLALSEFLTDEKTGSRPTVYYAYRPCQYTLRSLADLAGRTDKVADQDKVLLKGELSHGADDLGVMFYMDDGTTFWYGNKLDVQAANKYPHNSATTLQVTSTIAATIEWMIKNPKKGVIEVESIDSQAIMASTSNYIGKCVGVWGTHDLGDLTLDKFLMKEGK